MKHIKRFLDKYRFSGGSAANNMTALVVLFACCFIGIAVARTDMEIKRLFIQQALDCSKEYPASGDDIQMLKDHKIPTSNAAKCLIGCMFKKMDWVDDKGMFNDKNAYNWSEKEYPDDHAKLENAKKLYEVCTKVNEKSLPNDKEGCERSALLATCLTEHAPKMGFFF